MRVAVIGAGMAGLSAAHELLRGGADPVVFEASGRAGGKVGSVAERWQEGIDPRFRIGNAVQDQGIDDDGPLGAAGHVRKLTERLSRNEPERFRVDLAAYPGDPNEGVIDVPKDQGRLGWARHKPSYRRRVGGIPPTAARPPKGGAWPLCCASIWQAPSLIG